MDGAWNAHLGGTSRGAEPERALSLRPGVPRDVARPLSRRWLRRRAGAGLCRAGVP